MQNIGEWTSVLKDWKPEELLGTYNKPLGDQSLVRKGAMAIAGKNNPIYGTLSMMPKVYQEHKAIKTLGQDIGVLHSLLGTNPAINQLKQKIDYNNDGIITPKEFNITKNFSQKAFQRGKPEPIQTMPTDTSDPKKAGIVPMFEHGTYTDNPYITPTSNINPPTGVGITGDLGGAIGAGYKGSKAFGSGGKGIATGIDTRLSAATIGRGKGTGTSFADDAQSADTGTFICTCLHDIGDLKKYIYKYDQLYATRVNPAIYRGYTTWGKYIANKMRSKGIIYKIIKPIALAWAYQMAYDLSKGKVGKKSMFIKLTKNLGEGICYILGQTIKRRL